MQGDLCRRGAGGPRVCSPRPKRPSRQNENIASVLQALANSYSQSCRRSPGPSRRPQPSFLVVFETSLPARSARPPHASDDARPLCHCSPAATTPPPRLDGAAEARPSSKKSSPRKKSRPNNEGHGHHNEALGLGRRHDGLFECGHLFAHGGPERVGAREKRAIDVCGQVAHGERRRDGLDLRQSL